MRHELQKFTFSCCTIKPNFLIKTNSLTKLKPWSSYFGIKLGFKAEIFTLAKQLCNFCLIRVDNDGRTHRRPSHGHAGTKQPASTFVRIRSEWPRPVEAGSGIWYPKKYTARFYSVFCYVAIQNHRH